MAVTTFTLPSGSKFRSQSSRRFVVVAEYTPGKPTILYRSDQVNRAITYSAKHTKALVVDTLGRKVRVFGTLASGKLGYVWVDA